jgi:hypothetical protein
MSYISGIALSYNQEATEYNYRPRKNFLGKFKQKLNELNPSTEAYSPRLMNISSFDAPAFGSDK